MSRFQLIFTGILVALGVGGAILFAISKNNASQSAPQVTMWGTLNGSLVSSFISDVVTNGLGTLNVNYVQKNPTTFESELIAALARGAGPDMVLLPQDLILKQLDKYYVVPFDSYSERLFKDSFVPEGEMFLTSTGIIGFPFSIDPMVMYWNRDMLSNEGIAQPPASWVDFFTLVPKLVKKDSNGNIVQSLVAFGEMRNVLHGKDMVALLSMQAGTPIIGQQNGTLMSVFDASGQGLVPAEQAVSFYTQFSDPNKSTYSWNRSLPTDRNAFLSGQLAVYFGYASELPALRAANPNLNFDVTMMPQTDGKKMTFGAMNAVVILNSSKNIAAAFDTATTMTAPTIEQYWSDLSGLPPTRRDLITKLPGDAYKAVFYRSALIANAWLDPNRDATLDVFGRLVENVTSGKLRISESVHQASIELDTLLRSN